MNIKKYLDNGTGLIWKEIRYIKAPNFPYFIFIDIKKTRGADNLNNIIEHNLILEYYDEKVDKKYLKIIKDFLDKEGYSYEEDSEWLDTEKMYVTVFELEKFLEKVRKEGNQNA